MSNENKHPLEEMENLDLEQLMYYSKLVKVANIVLHIAGASLTSIAFFLFMFHAIIFGGVFSIFATYILVLLNTSRNVGTKLQDFIKLKFK